MLESDQLKWTRVEDFFQNSGVEASKALKFFREEGWAVRLYAGGHEEMSSDSPLNVLSTVLVESTKAGILTRGLEFDIYKGRVIAHVKLYAEGGKDLNIEEAAFHSALPSIFPVTDIKIQGFREIALSSNIEGKSGLLTSELIFNPDGTFMLLTGFSPDPKSPLAVTLFT